MAQALTDAANNLLNGFIVVAVVGVVFFIIRIMTLDSRR